MMHLISSDFLSQVNGWGFRRITTPGPDFNAYWHELFLRGLPDLAQKMKRPQKNDPDFKNEEPPDFYRLNKFSPLSTRNGSRVAPAVANSSSISSGSCEPPSRDIGYAHPGNPHLKETQAGRKECPTLDSWDHTEQGSAGDVAINLSDIYDKEASRSGAYKVNSSSHQLSEADTQYLVQQNRALLQQVQSLQQRKRVYGDVFRR